MKKYSRNASLLKRNTKFIVSLFLLLIVPILWDTTPQGKLIGLILILLFGVYVFFKSRGMSTSLLPYPLLLLLIFFIYQTILLSITPLPQYSVELIVTNFAGLIFLISVMVSHELGWKTTIWENALMSVAILFSLWGMSLIFSFYMEWIKDTGSISLPPISLRLWIPFVGHPNHFAGFLNLLIPIAFVRLIRKKTYQKLFVWSGVLTLFLIMEFYTSSRGGLIGLISGISTTLFLINLPRFRCFLEKQSLFNNVRFRLSIRQWVFSIIVVSLCIFVGILIVRQIYMTPHGGRWAVWISAWNIFSTSPFIGRGIGSYSFLYPSINQSSGGDNLYHAHNLWLQIGAETGIIGILLVLSITSLVSYRFLSAWKIKNTNITNRYNLAAYAGIGVALLVHNLVDFLFRSPLYYFSVILVFALLLLQITINPIIKSTRKRDLFIMGVLAMSSILGSIYSLKGFTLYSNGMNAAKDGDWSTARDEICTVAEDNESFTLFDFQCSLASAMISFQTSDEQILESAIHFQREGLDKDPYWAIHWSNLASYEWEKGNKTEALILMRKAVNNIPIDSMLQLNLGWMEEELGHQEEAKDAYRSAIVLNPWFRESIFFTKNTLRSEVLETSSIYTYDDRPFVRSYWEGWRAYLAGDFVEAEKQFYLTIRYNPNLGDAYAALGLIQQKMGRPDPAWNNIKTALFINKSSFWTLYLSYKVAMGQGKYSVSMKYLTDAFNLLQNSNGSFKYYDAAYGMEFLPIDKSPYLLQWALSPQMIKDFQGLASYYRQHGDVENYQQLMSMIDNEVSR